MDDPERLVVVSGFTQGLRVTCRVLRQNGARRVAVEDPGYVVGRAIVTHTGLEVVGVPVDAQGLCVETLDDLAVDAVL